MKRRPFSYEVDRGNDRAGFTLAETLIAAVVLACAVTAIAMAITAGQVQLHHSVNSQSAVRLTEELVERILALPYADPDGESALGPEVGEIGPLDFDNADDFHGHTEAAGELRDVAGSLYPQSYQQFSRSVSARYESITVAGLGGPIPGLTVTVTARDLKGQTWTLTRFIRE